MKRYTKSEAASIVVNCVAKYEKELKGKNLLFVCANKHKQISTLEMSFPASNYMHLTGLKPAATKANDLLERDKLFANDFYQKCLDHRLSEHDFDFADNGTTHLKLELLPQILCKNLRANIIGNYNSSRPQLHTEKIVGNVNACMGFVHDKNVNSYVPNTLMKEDARNLILPDQLRVIEVYRKDSLANKYTERTFRAKKIDFDNVTYPEHFKYLIEIE